MVKNEVHIYKCRWRLKIYYAVTCYHTDEILYELQRIDCPDDLLKHIQGNIERSEMDSGFTFSNKRKRESLIIIGLFSSKGQFLNSFSHELRHLVDDISKTDGIDPGGEEVAYLTGDINQLLTGDVQMFICDCSCCRGELKRRMHDY